MADNRVPTIAQRQAEIERERRAARQYDQAVPPLGGNPAAYVPADHGSSSRQLTEREAETIALLIGHAAQPQGSGIAVTGEAWRASEGDRSVYATSAQDRAHALKLRMAMITAIAAGAAVLGVVAYVALLMAMGVSEVLPWQLDKILVFLVVVVIITLTAYRGESMADYDHSHSGVERLRIVSAVDVRKAEIEAEAEVRLAALDASLKLIEKGVRRNG